MAKLQDIAKEMGNQPAPGRSTLSKVTALATLGASLTSVVLCL